MSGAERKVAVVTGASSGIGAATARALAAVGYLVIVGARRVNRLEALAREIGGSARPLDVTDMGSGRWRRPTIRTGRGCTRPTSSG